MPVKTEKKIVVPDPKVLAKQTLEAAMLRARSPLDEYIIRFADGTHQTIYAHYMEMTHDFGLTFWAFVIPTKRNPSIRNMFARVHQYEFFVNVSERNRMEVRVKLKRGKTK